MGAGPLLRLAPVSCLDGGHEITLVSEYDLKKDVVPVFQVYDEFDEPCELSQRLNQPKIKCGLSSNDHGLYIGKKTSFIMLCPGQGRELLTELTTRRLKLKILIKRGKYVSQKKFDFKYLEVSGDHCPYHLQHNHLLPHRTADHRTPLHTHTPHNKPFQRSARENRLGKRARNQPS